MRTIRRNLILTVLFSMAHASAQQLVIPQVADGGGWRSTLVLTNTALATSGVSMTFYKDVAGVPGTTGPWSPTFEEGGLPTTLPAGSSVYLHTPGTGALSQGWAEVAASTGVAAYVIYTFSSNGRDQDATAPAVSSASRILVPFDNTIPSDSPRSLVTALAVVNPNPLPLTIAANFRLSGPAGTVVQGTPLGLPANGQVAFLLPSQFPATANASGLAEFYSTSGAGFSIIGLRANPTGGLTSLQVYFETGPPII